MKTVKVLVAALAAVAIAVPAMAVTADISGNLWIRGIMTDNMVGDDVTTRAFDQRLRLFTTAAANENVKMVLGLEVDNVWGAFAGQGEVGSMGADAKGQLEIKHFYLDFKVPTVGATVRAGTQAFNFGRGMIINDDAAGMQFTIPVAGNNLSLTYIRPQARRATTSSDSSNFYGAKYDLKFGDVKIAPYVGLLKNGSWAPVMPGGEVMYGGIDVDGKAGNFGYAFTAIYNDWEETTAGVTTDGNGMALFGKVTTKIDRLGLSLEAGYMGDSDRADGQFVSLRQSATTGALVNISELTTGGRFTSNAGAASPANINGAGTLYRTDWLFAKIGADLQLTKALKGSVFIAHIQEAEGPNGNDRTYGQEVNAYLDYAIVPNLDLTLMGAYLFANSDMTTIVGHDDNIYKVGTMLAYRF